MHMSGLEYLNQALVVYSMVNTKKPPHWVMASKLSASSNCKMQSTKCRLQNADQEKIQIEKNN